MTDQTLHCHDLLPCPFCRRKGIRGDHSASDGVVLYDVRCRCGAGVNDFFSREEADAAWNTRAQAPAPEGGEAVAWQYRMVLASGRASDWQACSEELFDYYVKRPMFDDTTIETRALYTRSNAKEGEVDARLLAMANELAQVQSFDPWSAKTISDAQMLLRSLALSTPRGDAGEMGESP